VSLNSIILVVSSEILDFALLAHTLSLSSFSALRWLSFNNSEILILTSISGSMSQPVTHSCYFISLLSSLCCTTRLLFFSVDLFFKHVHSFWSLFT
jgi:hypothetical protein